MTGFDTTDSKMCSTMPHHVSIHIRSSATRLKKSYRLYSFSFFTPHLLAFFRVSQISKYHDFYALYLLVRLL